MNVLVTGANGFIGKNLACALQNISTGKDSRWPKLDIKNVFTADKGTAPSELELYCKKADFVFNFAGINRPKEPEEFASGNVGFLKALLDNLQRYRNICPVMLASSTQALLDNPYGISKKAAEDQLLHYSDETGARVLIYRFPNVFGKWCRPNYNSAIATFCYNTANDLLIQVNDANTRMVLVYIDDLVEEMLRALSGKETREGSRCIVPVYHETTLGFVAETIQSFPQLRASFYTPCFSDALVSKLYSTYLSYLPKEKLLYDLETNLDGRGSFTEVIKTVDSGQFSVNISKPGIVKGNHWHNSKNEKFVVVKGKGRIQLRQIGKDDNGNDYPVLSFDVSGDKMQVLEMIPGYTHNIINLSDTEDLITLIWANECFDTKKPDTFAEKV